MTVLAAILAALKAVPALAGLATALAQWFRDAQARKTYRDALARKAAKDSAVDAALGPPGGVR